MSKKFIDIAGQKFNKWTVLELVSKGSNINSKWKCQCECGKYYIIALGDLKSGRSKGCKKCMGKLVSERCCIDLIGKQFGEWTVLDKSKSTNIGQSMWKCRCSCGKLKIVQGGNLRYGLSKSCGHCNFYEDIKGHFWTRICRSARSRNIEFDINIQDVWELWKKQNGKCAYTGIDLKMPILATKNTGTASLDRIDSNKGYIKNNIQWVHRDVNRMKWILSNDEFLQICFQITTYNQLNYSTCYLNNYSVDYNKSTHKMKEYNENIK